MFGFLRVDHCVVEDLCRTDDNIRVPQHLPEEVPLLALATDGDHSVDGAQARLELLAVMLVYKVNLRRRRHRTTGHMRSFVDPAPSVGSSAYLVDQDHHLCIGSGLQVSFGHIHSSTRLSSSGWQANDDVFSLQSPLDHFLLVGVQSKICHCWSLLTSIRITIRMVAERWKEASCETISNLKLKMNRLGTHQSAPLCAPSARRRGGLLNSAASKAKVNKKVAVQREALEEQQLHSAVQRPEMPDIIMFYFILFFTAFIKLKPNLRKLSHLLHLLFLLLSGLPVRRFGGGLCAPLLGPTLMFLVVISLCRKTKLM